MSKIGKKIALLFVLAGLMASLTGCATAKLADGFDAEQVESSGKEVIELLHNRDYQTIIDRSREDLRADVTVDSLKEQIDPKLDKLGNFVEYKKVVTGGSKDKTTDEDYGTAMITAKYEDGKATYTISFDKENNLVGFYMK
ncbi:DUF3887 domain-containing protein [Anaerolentibacter hominis]|uniref:DUF3887 domain-containing protein n=1 Tax=Anaerolentibacter hominis TaxID=3079009 RepID=UPI0031B89B16